MKILFPYCLTYLPFSFFLFFMQTLIERLKSTLGIKKTPSEEEQKLFYKTQDFIWYIKWIPGLRMIAVSNSLAMYATHEDSDIDLFIITAPNRIWIVRTLILGIATILKVRAKPGDEAGKFCFPFFMTEEHLSLKEVAIENDIYLAYWIMTLKPIFNIHYTYERFIEINQAFYENTLQINPFQKERAELLNKNKEFLIPLQKNDYGEVFWNIFSTLLSLKNSFLGYISKELIAKKIPSGTEGIVLNNKMVKLHFNDRRKEIQKKIVNQY